MSIATKCTCGHSLTGVCTSSVKECNQLIMEKTTQLPITIEVEIDKRMLELIPPELCFEGDQTYDLAASKRYEVQEVITAYATKLHQVEQENAELRRWKMEAAELLTKIHSYAHKHLEIKLGESIVDFVIARAKERDELKRQNDKMKEQAEGWRPLLEKVLVMNEMWGDLPGEFINEVKKYLYGE